MAHPVAPQGSAEHLNRCLLPARQLLTAAAAVEEGMAVVVRLVVVAVPVPVPVPVPEVLPRLPIAVREAAVVVLVVQRVVPVVPEP
jgi:hypothetical protein